MYPMAIAFDREGSLLITDAYNHRIRKVDAKGIVATIAGTGKAASDGDGGPAVKASVHGPEGIAVDGAGNIYFAEPNANRVRRIAPDGTISTFAGTGAAGNSGNGGPAAKATLNRPTDVKVDAAGNVAIAEYSGAAVRRVRPDGTIERMAGGAFGNRGDGGPAANAQLVFPDRLAYHPEGALYLAEFASGNLRRIGMDGTITRVGGLTDDLWGGPAPETHLLDPVAATLDANGNLLIAEGEGRHLHRIGGDGRQEVLAGDGLCCSTPRATPAREARFNLIRDVLAMPDGAVLLADYNSHSIYRLRDGVAEILTGAGIAGDAGDGGPAAKARVRNPVSLAADKGGSVYFIDSGNRRLRRIDPEGLISTVAAVAANASVAAGPDGTIWVGENASGSAPPRISRLAVDGRLEPVVEGCGAGFAVDDSGAFFCIVGQRVAQMTQRGEWRAITGAAAGSTDGEVNAAGARLQSPALLRAISGGRVLVVDRKGNRVYELAPRQ
jgi:sugar lactone lactonase YvrE